MGRLSGLFSGIVQRSLAWLLQGFSFLWHSNSGTWKWLSEDSRSLASLNRQLWRGVVPSANFYLMLFLSSIVCTLGLLANSTAVIIGAMIITPLLNPVISIAFSMIISNRRLFKRASLTLSLGIILVIINSMVLCYLIGIRNLNPEILLRSAPTILDLVVAIAAGAAGAFANARIRVGNALPGVAIAVALLPPVCTIGIGIALNSQETVLGSTLLFATNLTGIIFGGGVTFLVSGYGSLDRAKHSLSVAIVLLIILGLPLGFSLRQLLIREQAQQSIEFLVRQRYRSTSTIDIRRIRVEDISQGRITVFVELVAPSDQIQESDRQTIEQELETSLETEIALRLRIIPSYELNPSSK